MEIPVFTALLQIGQSRRLLKNTVWAQMLMTVISVRNIVQEIPSSRIMLSFDIFISSPLQSFLCSCCVNMDPEPSSTWTS